MFSWSKKKDSKKRGRPERSSEENEFGIKIDKGPSDKQLEAELKALAGVDDLPEDDLNLGEGGEEDVESELLRLIGGGKGKRPLRKPTSENPLRDATADISADIPADIEDVGDEDVEVDENDPDLLGELLELTQPEEEMEEPEPEAESDTEAPPQAGESDPMTILKERLKMYKAAEAKAKENNESSRARRFNRGIKTLEDLIKKAKAGKPVSPGDIPPVIAMNLKPAPPPQPESTADDSEVNLEGNEVCEEVSQESPDEPQPEPEPVAQEPVDVMATLMERLQLYKTAESKAKESGETTRARRFSRGIKTLEGLIRQAKSGNPVSSSDIPPAVALNLKPAPPAPPPGENQTVDGGEEGVEQEMGSVNLSQTPSEYSNEEEPERNVLDVLLERLEMYKTAEEKARESGEDTRARRFSRGIKTIQDMIKQTNGGRPVSPSDIPPPIALKLKPPPSPVVLREEEEEEEPRQASVQSDSLVKSSFNPSGPPLKFAAPDDDIDIDEELTELEIPETVLEGLEQRVRIYTNLKHKAEEEGNEALAHESEQNIRIYLNAIRTYKSGGYIDVENLPTPKGAPPIPIPFQIPP